MMRLNQTFFMTVLLLLVGVVSVSALEMALTKSGKKVVLKNDGTWEMYNPQKHLDVADLRAPAQEIAISIKYYDYKFYLDEKKMWWDGTGVTGQALKDSIKTVPKGGMIRFLISSESIQPNDPKRYLFTLKNSKQQLIEEEEGIDIQARDSDDVGISILKELPIKKAMRGEAWVYVKDLTTGQTYQFNIPMK